MMLITIAQMLNTPVMSLQTGTELARIDQPIIDPHNLKIMAFYVHGMRLDFEPAILFTDDIRELGNMGAIVDSTDNIMPPDGLVRLQQLIAYNFKLDGIRVIDDHKHKLGRVENYTINPDTFEVQQLYLKPTFSKQFSLASLTIDRSQIINIDNQKIVVRAPSVRAKTAQTVSATPNAVPFENPFRKPKPAAEVIKTSDN
jgi:sporulation protein YlmC with PRC-barrel domain